MSKQAHARQHRHRHLPLRLLSAGLLVAALPAAQAVEMTAGDWKIDVGGYINAYYTSVSCGSQTVGGLALAGRALGCGGESSRTTIGNGLLPNALVTKFSTEQEGYQLGGTIGIMAHTATDSAIDANSGVDVRQAFFTIGNDRIGSFKLGRDYGVFGSNAILSDMTLMGVGAPVQATQRGRVSLGHIGAGYTYLGNYGQIAWTSPAAGGFSATVAVVSPVGNNGAYEAKSVPQVQAQLLWKNDNFRAWVGAKTQRFYNRLDEDDQFTMRGFEAGAAVTAGRFGGLVNVQTGTGLGILADGDQQDTKSTNWLAQGTFGLTDKVKLGANYGISRNRDQTPGTGGLKSNANATLGVYWQLTKAVTLALEGGRTRSEAFDGTTVDMNGGSVGGIIFF
ncbi:porin [Pseudoxanthomonas winnipegensis]|nr:porin [Pseudoxanthomonas winnipegensis]